MVAHSRSSILIPACLLLLLTLSACQQDTQSRGKIAVSARSGQKNLNQKSKSCLQMPRTEKNNKGNSDNKAKSEQKADEATVQCLNLSTLQECLSAEGSQLARSATVDIHLQVENKDSKNRTALKDQKLLAQILNESDDLKISYSVKRFQDFKPALGEGMDVVAQNSCKSVTLRDDAGTLHEYSIEPARKQTSKLILKGTKIEDGWKVIDNIHGRLIVQTVRPMEPIQRCGSTHNVYVSKTQELFYGEFGSSQIYLSSELAQLIAEQTEASAAFVQMFKSNESTGTRNAKTVKRPGASRVSINEAVWIDALSRAQKGQFKNLDCAKN